MSAYDDLLEALEAELHDHRWWKTPSKTKPKKRGMVPAVAVFIEDELTTARRREELDKEWSAFHKRHRDETEGAA